MVVKAQKADQWEQIAPHLRQLLDQGLAPGVVADFCGVKPDAVRYWYRVGPPRGLPLVKAWYFVQLAGASIPPLPRNNEAVELAFELLGYGVIDLDDIKKILVQKNDQGVYRIFRSGSVMNLSSTYEQLIQEYGEYLDLVKDEYTNRIRESLENESAEVRTPSAPVMEQPRHEAVEVEADSEDEAESELPEPILIDLASSLSALLPVIRLFSDGDAGETVRPLLGREGVKLLSGLLVPSKASTSTDPVKRLAELLQDLAPLVHDLYEDDSTDGDFERERLRQIVGPLEFSETIVRLTAFRSHQGYDRSKKKGAIN